MAKITLCGVTFPRSDDAKRYLLDKMNAYPIGAPVPAADVPLWFEVLQKHEWFAEYVEHGIQYFAVAWSEQRPKTCAT